MASNYKRLGNYIQQVDVRNTDLSVELLLGVSIEKKFIESHANTVGTDFSKYKIVKRGQFAYGPVTSRNGDKISIALLDEVDACLISSSYTPFEIVKPDELNAEYLMMLFRNPEYDRFARYNSWGSAREVFSWEDFCDSELYIPDIEEQQKIVRQYKTITDRIEVLEKINEKLEDLIKNVFNHYFFDYASIENIEFEKTEYGEAPKGWKYYTLGDLCSTVTKGTTPTTLGMDFVEEGINFVKGESINDNHSFNKKMFAHIDDETNKLLRRSQMKENDILFSIAGTLGKFVLMDKKYLPANTNQAISIIRANPKKIDPLVLYSYFISDWQTEFYRRNAQPGVQDNLSLATMKNLPILIADASIMNQYKTEIYPILANIRTRFREIDELNDLLENVLRQIG